MIKRLLGVVMGQSGFQGWISALGVNKRIALLDERAEGLKDAILCGEIDVAALATTADSLLRLFFPGGTHMPPGATEPETLGAAQARIAAQYASEITELSTTPGQAEAFRDAVLAFESAAGLGARDFMTIYGITATDTELAGAGLRAFLGFFDQTFRDHDYDVGRAHARQVLTNPELANSGGIGPIMYAGSAIRPIDARLDGLKMSGAPAADLDKKNPLSARALANCPLRIVQQIQQNLQNLVPVRQDRGQCREFAPHFDLVPFKTRMNHAKGGLDQFFEEDLFVQSRHAGMVLLRGYDFLDVPDVDGQRLQFIQQGNTLLCKVSTQFGQIGKHTRSHGIAGKIFIELSLVLPEHVEQCRQVFRAQLADFFRHQAG
jgi:hypothetical protein